MATVRPALAAAARIVGAQRYLAEFIITSSPVAGSRKKLPLMPWTDGGTPVTMEALLTLVKEGNAPRATPRKPLTEMRCKLGVMPLAIAASRYSSLVPSRQMTTTERAGG